MDQNDIILKGLEDQLHKAEICGQGEVFFNNIIDSIEIHEISKGGKKAVVGEKRVFGGKNYVKTNNGWRPEKKGKEDFHDTHTPDQAALEQYHKKEESKYQDWDSQKHTEQSWQHHGNMIRAQKEGKSSVASWEKNEMNRHIDLASKKAKAELDKRGAEKKPHDYVKGSPNALVQESIDKFADKKGKVKFDAVVQDLLSQNIDPEKIKSGLRNLRPGHTVGEDSSFVDKEFERVAGSKSSPSTKHIGDMSREEKIAAGLKFGIKNATSLSEKQLNKELMDKNVEKQLAEFKAKRNLTTFKDVLSDPEGRQIVEGIEGLDLKREDHKSLYEDYKKQLKQKFNFEYKE